MAWHLYFVPILPEAGEFGRRAKYLNPADLSPAIFQIATIHWGNQPGGMCAANIDDATDALVQLNSDVIRVPDNLDLTLTAANVTAVQNALEAVNLPAQWVNTTMTWRTLIRILYGFKPFLDRYHGLHQIAGTLIDGTTISLNTQFQNLSLQTRQRLLAVAQTLNLDTSGMSGTTTLRQILKAVSDLWGQGPIKMGGIVV